MIEDQDQLAVWMAAVSVGSETALVLLYRATRERVRRAARRWNADESALDEVVNDTFLQAWNTARSYSAARGPVIAWLQMIARSRAIDGVRCAARHRCDPLGEEHEAIAACAAQERDTIGWTSRCDTAFSGLRAAQRQVLVLSFTHGRSHDEIADRLDLPLGTVKSLARRGLQHLGQGIRPREMAAA